VVVSFVKPGFSDAPKVSAEAFSPLVHIRHAFAFSRFATGKSPKMAIFKPC